MRKYKLTAILILAMLVACSLPYTAQAYIDPGTTGSILSGSIWAVVAPFLAMAAAFIGLMFRPIRVFFGSLISKLVGGSKAEPIETKENPAPGDLPGGGERGENTGGDLKS